MSPEVITLFAFAILVGLFNILMLMNRTLARNRKAQRVFLSHLSQKLDALLSLSGETPEAAERPLLSANVRRHLPHQKIAAIKAYREEHRVDLKEAKEAIDAYCVHEPHVTQETVEAKLNRLMTLMGGGLPATADTDITERVAQLVRENKKLDAIKEYRNAKETTLAEAKAAVYSIEAHLLRTQAR